MDHGEATENARYDESEIRIRPMKLFKILVRKKDDACQKRSSVTEDVGDRTWLTKDGGEC